MWATHPSRWHVVGVVVRLDLKTNNNQTHSWGSDEHACAENDDRGANRAAPASDRERCRGGPGGKTTEAGTEKQTYAGGIAKSDGWHTIRKYSLAELRKAMTAGNGSVTPDGADRKVYGASFMTIDGRHLYAGKFSRNTATGCTATRSPTTDP
jgi:hypothetical protein